MRSPIASSYRKLGIVLVAALLAAYGAGSVARARESVRRPAGAAEKVQRSRASSGTAPALPPAALIGANIHVNDPNADDASALSHIQSETAIAVNPISGTICVGFNDYSGFGSSLSLVGFASSNDDGATFQDRGVLPQIPQAGGGTLGAFSDPALVWRKFDNKFYFVSVLGFAEGLALWMSNDDCKTFVPVMDIVIPPNDGDKPMVTVDNDPASPRYGRVYVTFKDAAQRVAVLYSDDMATWSAPVDLSPNGPKANGSWPVVVGGTLYVFWSQMNGATYDIKYVSSATGAAPFSAVASAVSGAITPYNAAASPDPLAPTLNGNVRYQAFPEVAAGSDGCLHLAYAVGPNSSHTGDCSDVYYRRSCNGGAWTTALKINDDATATDQWDPTISVGAGGIVSIGYYDRRVTVNNTDFRYTNRISLDNGATFQASTAISSGSSPVALEPVFGSYHGDYDMQVQRPGALYIVWSDDRDVTAGANSPDVWFQKVCPQTGCTIAPAQPRQLAPISAPRSRRSGRSSRSSSATARPACASTCAAIARALTSWAPTAPPEPRSPPAPTCRQACCSGDRMGPTV